MLAYEELKMRNISWNNITEEELRELLDMGDEPKQTNTGSIKGERQIEQSWSMDATSSDKEPAPALAVKKVLPSDLSTDELLAELAELREGDYRLIRDRYLKLNAEMNERRQIPPSLRGLRRPRPEKKRGAEDQQLMHDLQVIDLHWLHAKHRSVYADQLIEGKLARAFARFCQREEISMEIAIEIAKTGSTNEKKCDALGITEVHQPELSNLRTDEVREAQNSFFSRYQKARGNIRARALGYKYGRPHADTWAIAWGAAEWLKLVGRKFTPKQLAEAYIMLGGAEIKPASAVKKLISVRKLLGEQLEPQLESYYSTPAKQPTSSQNAGTP